MSIGTLETNIYKGRNSGYNARMKRISIVTGASSGMGDCFARQLALEGRDSADEIWIIARRGDRLERLKQEIEQGKAGPGGCPAIVPVPLDIAGKTGTAENSQGTDHGWFVGYGPFDYPTISVAVIVEQGGFGASSAVPIGRQIMEAAFNLQVQRGELAPPPARGG